MAGKTGTAQVDSYCPTARLRAGYLTWPAYKQDTSVFASFAPADDPRFAVDALFEQSGYGADVAAPAVEQEYLTLFGLNKPAHQSRGTRRGPARRTGRDHDARLRRSGRLMAYATLPARPPPSARRSPAGPWSAPPGATSTCC